LSIDEVEVSHSGVFKYRLTNYYSIPSYDRDLWESKKDSPRDPYGTSRILIHLFNNNILDQYGQTDYLTLTHGVQWDLAERWVKESGLAPREEPDVVY
jgi:hypothetical protein